METNKEYLQRLLPLLKKEIPSQWRVQSYSKNKPIATVMSYIDQRDLMDVLDAYCDYGWEKRYEEVAGNVFCSIGIHMPDGTTHWRSDCGVESQSDAEKGRASDAAKRAGVNWGVGRFLYDKKIQYVPTNVKKEGNNYPYCIDEQGKQIWDLTTYINNKNPNAPKAPVSVAEPTIDQKVQQMNPAKSPLTEEKLKQYKEAIDKIVSATGLTGYYNSLAADVQANKTVQQYLKDKRDSLKAKA